MRLTEIQERWKNRQPECTEASIRAWDSVAGDSCYVSVPKLEEDPFLRFLTEHVPLKPEMTALDIGCGAGVYSIALAPHLGHVTGSDFSSKMIEAARRLAAERRTDNVDFVCEDWHTCEIRGRERAFDLVFAHMTPAVNDYSTFYKMIQCSRRFCLMEKPVRRSIPLLDELRRMAGEPDEIRAQQDDSVAYAFCMLWEMGFRPKLAYRDQTWVSERPLEQACTWYLGRLQETAGWSERTASMARDFLCAHAENGVVRETSTNTIVSMAWETVR